MRSAAVLRDASGLGPHDHVCWSFDDDATVRREMLAFLADGLAVGQHVRYVGADVHTATALESLVRAADGRDDAWSVQLVGQINGHDVIEPDALVAAYAAATDRAERAGFVGLRVAAHATPLVRTPAQRAAFARSEHLIDRFMTGRPFAAMCAYDVRELGPAAVAEIAAMHPAVSHGACRFRVFATGDADVDVAVAGEIDVAVGEAFRQALDRSAIAAKSAPAELVVDGTGIDYIDHRGMIALGDRARRVGSTAVLRTRSSTPARLVEILGLESIRVELVA